MVQLSSGQYFLTNKKAGTVCDLSGQDNRSVIGFPKQGSQNQKVRFPSFSFKVDPDLPTVA
jgi:hypothetical protein